MNNISKDFTDDAGTTETVVASSNDDYNLNLNQKYVLVNKKQDNESKLSKKIKNSLFGADIGIKSGGFSNVAILAIVVALAAFVILYFLWRF